MKRAWGLTRRGVRMIGRAMIKHRIKGVVLDYWQLVAARPRRIPRKYHLRMSRSRLPISAGPGLFCSHCGAVNQEGNTARRRGPN